jgi:tetratricopeptide (TPR) repeat protein
MRAPRWSLVLLMAGAAGCADCERRQAEPVDWEIQNLYQRGTHALMEGNYRAAEKELRKVLARDESHSTARTKLARALEKRAEAEPRLAERLLAEAVELLGQASQRRPTSKVVWSALARVARKAGRPDEAIRALRRLHQLDPDNTATLVTIAAIQLEAGRPEAAEKTYRDGITADDGPLRLAYARYLLGRGERERARELLGSIVACPEADDELEQPPPCPTRAYYEAQDELATLAVQRGDLKEARAIYEGLVELFPDDYMVWELLAAMDEKAGRHQQAEAKYRKSLAVDRSHMSGWRGLGRCLMAQGELEDAAFAFRKADRFLSDSPAQALEMADELVQLGERGWARSLLERAAILSRGDAELNRAVQAKLAGLAAATADGGAGTDGAGADRPATGKQDIPSEP